MPISYKQWIDPNYKANGQYWLGVAKVYNDWRQESLDDLLTNYGPRLAALGKVNYTGSGFHYTLIEHYGKLVKSLAIDWYPCTNHLYRLNEDYARTIAVGISFEMFTAEIKQAEESV